MSPWGQRSSQRLMEVRPPFDESDLSTSGSETRGLGLIIVSRWRSYSDPQRCSGSPGNRTLNLRIKSPLDWVFRCFSMLLVTLCFPC
jgi:hypothetical protein